MEPKGIKANPVLMSLLLLLAIQSTAMSFKDCYNRCYHGCRDLGKSKALCSFDCLMECLPSTPSEVDLQCSLPCTLSACRHLDPEAKDMEHCMHACFTACTEPAIAPSA